MLLYVSIRQNFRLWFVPGYCADVRLVTVLGLTTDPHSHSRNARIENETTVFAQGNKEDVEIKSEAQRGSIEAASGKVAGDVATDSESSVPAEWSTRKTLYFIQSQNDLYQVSEFIKFIVPYGIGSGLILLWHFGNTLLCVLGAIALSPITWLLEYALGGNSERIRSGAVFGQD